MGGGRRAKPGNSILSSTATEVSRAATKGAVRWGALPQKAKRCHQRCPLVFLAIICHPSVERTKNAPRNFAAADHTDAEGTSGRRSGIGGRVFLALPPWPKTAYCCPLWTRRAPKEKGARVGKARGLTSFEPVFDPRARGGKYFWGLKPLQRHQLPPVNMNDKEQLKGATTTTHGKSRRAKRTLVTALVEPHSEAELRLARKLPRKTFALGDKQRDGAPTTSYFEKLRNRTEKEARWPMAKQKDRADQAPLTR